MPRRMRTKTDTGIYHVMLRGNERKNIFIDDTDKVRITDTLLLKKASEGFVVYAFCILDNHIHLLIKEHEEPISTIIKRIATSYAYYYNKKHNRIGHVFQDRFKSECITSEGQLLEVIRYIHNNPVKANIVNSASEYEWSSYNRYIFLQDIQKEQKYKEILKDLEEILQIFSRDIKKARKLFIAFTRERTDLKFMDIETEDEKNEFKIKIENFLISENISNEDIHNDKALRDKIIRELKYVQNIPGRKIAMVLEIDRNIVQKMKE